MTIVFVTHDQWEAMSLASTIAVMRDGTLQQVAPPEDIYDRPANRFVAEFIGAPPINIIELGRRRGACCHAGTAICHPVPHRSDCARRV